MESGSVETWTIAYLKVPQVVFCSVGSLTRTGIVPAGPPGDQNSCTQVREYSACFLKKYIYIQMKFISEKINYTISIPVLHL